MSKQKDAELVLKLYELRRDEELRKARQWYIGKFNPQSAQDLAGQLLSGPKASAHYRMVVSYWDMCAAIVLQGGIDEQMFLSTNGELIMVYAKIQPYLEEARQLIGRPEYLKNLETVAHRFPNAEEAFESRRRLAAIWLKAAEKEG
jgi:hypothetical protein